MKRILWEKIYDYLNGSMDERAAKRFEQALKNDPVLRENFTIMKGLKEMLERREERLKILELIKHARENYYQEKQKRINRRRRFNRVCKIWPKKNCN